MRVLNLPLAIACCAWLSQSRADSAADAAACYTINDADSRAICLAKAHKDPGRCYSVQAADKRAQCLAEVRGR